MTDWGLTAQTQSGEIFVLAKTGIRNLSLQR